MLAIRVDLLAGRYHATEWGRAANEGVPEWPPAPWRLGRALASAWWRSGPDARPDAALVDGLFRRLAQPPRIGLPRATAGHTRHYMPRPGASEEKRTLVLDPFVRTSGDPVVFVWEDVELTLEEAAALGGLLAGVGYLGRTESPCTATLVASPPSYELEAAPFAGEEIPADVELARVLCLAPDATLEVLSAGTAERRRRGLVDPPAGRFLAYTVPAVTRQPRRLRPQRRPRPRPVALRYAIESAAPPPLTQALAVTDLLRSAALRRADGAPAETIRLLRGRHGDGPPESGHAHAHYLACDEDGDRRIDHLTVWCSAGLGREELRALDVRSLASWRLDYPLRLVLLEAVPAGRAAAGPLATAPTWRSHTPFLPVRHPKRRGDSTVNGWCEQVALELARRGMPRPQRLTPLRTGSRPWREFRLQRPGETEPWRLPALGFELEFGEPLQGPISLGRHSHFGMGLFLPARS